jgi:bacterial/archaeal transporter family protein
MKINEYLDRGVPDGPKPLLLSGSLLKLSAFFAFLIRIQRRPALAGQACGRAFHSPGFFGIDEMWIYLGFISAVFLGLYDISKKHAVTENPVLPVLFFSTLSGAMIMIPFVFLSVVSPSLPLRLGLYVGSLSPAGHGVVFIKALIVSTAWSSTFLGLKHLPISIAAPIAASGPIWTFIGALAWFGEKPSPLQWIGMLVSFSGYFAFQSIGQKEGIAFHKNRWIFFMVLGTLVNAGSALYDKFLIQSMHITPMAVQAWFMIYMVPVFGLESLAFRKLKNGRTTRLSWRASIPAAGALLIAADFVYFRALAHSGALIALLTVLRRGSVVLSFALGGRLFGEKRLRQKALALSGILLGIVLILLSV